MTAFELDLFTHLDKNPRSCSEILKDLSLPERSGTILLNACLALGLLLQDGENRLETEPTVASLLRKGANEPFRVTTYLIDYYAELYRDLSDMTEIVRTDGKSSGFNLRNYFADDVSSIDRSVVEETSAYMHATMKRISQVVLSVVDFANCSHLLDLCGGPGTLSHEILLANPGLCAEWIDIPPVVESASTAPVELRGRVNAIAGDVFHDPLPSADVITICRSAHDWDDERILELFKRVRASLNENGRFLVIERMIPERFDPAAQSLYLRSVYFLSKSTTARYRSCADYERMLVASGFRQIRVQVPVRDPYLFFPGLVIIEAT